MLNQTKLRKAVVETLAYGQDYIHLSLDFWKDHKALIYENGTATIYDCVFESIAKRRLKRGKQLKVLHSFPVTELEIAETAKKLTQERKAKEIEWAKLPKGPYEQYCNDVSMGIINRHTHPNDF